MEISIISWIATILALVYLLMLPGANIIRTLDWARKKAYTLPECAVVAFGLSVAILVLVSLALALSFSVGLNFYTLITAETLVIIGTTKEVVGFFRSLVKKYAA